MPAMIPSPSSTSQASSPSGSRARWAGSAYQLSRKGLGSAAHRASASQRAMLSAVASSAGVRRCRASGLAQPSMDGRTGRMPSVFSAVAAKRVNLSRDSYCAVRTGLTPSGKGKFNEQRQALISRHHRSLCNACSSAQPRVSPSARRRNSPSCATLATSRPSRLKMLPRMKPRAPPAHGLSERNSSQSSARNGAWNHTE